MTRQTGRVSHELSLAEGFERSGLTIDQALMEYLGAGGRCSREHLTTALCGQLTLGSHEHNKLAAVLNKHCASSQQEGAVPYYDDHGPTR